MASSASSPATTAIQPPITPIHSVQRAAASREERFVSHAATSNSTVTSSKAAGRRSEEHTSELQSRSDLVCRLLLEKKKKYLRLYYDWFRTPTRCNAFTPCLPQQCIARL